MFKKPTCRKCETPHYNFQRCAEVVEAEKAEKVRREASVVPVEWRSGERAWGDRLESFDRSGTTFWRRREE